MYIGNRVPVKVKLYQGGLSTKTYKIKNILPMHASFRHICIYKYVDGHK